MILIRDLCFSYGKKQVLQNINIRIASGSLNAIVGTNGVGKSTLFRCLSKQESVKNKMIFVDDKDVNEYTYQSYARKISLVSQLTKISGADLRVRDYMVEGRTPHMSLFSIPKQNDYLTVESVAKQLGIIELLGERVSDLSGGQQQLVALGRAMVQDTPVILLDEPMSALDLTNQLKLLKLFNQLIQQGKTVVFSTHNPNHALSLNCNTILLKNGTVMCDGKASKCLTNDNLHTIFSKQVGRIDYDGKYFCVLQLSEE